MEYKIMLYAFNDGKNVSRERHLAVDSAKRGQVPQMKHDL